MKQRVVSDSTFYSCCACDIQKMDLLFTLLSKYSFYLGPRILEELPKLLTQNNTFIQAVHQYSFDYYQLIKPFFGRDPKHIKDGEYEAIGLGYMLNEKDTLRFLIIDDRRSHNFAKRNFPSLATKIIRTIGFVKECCCQDHSISPKQALEFLEAIREAVITGRKSRPCSVDPELCTTILIPTIEYIRSYYASGRV